MKEDKIIGNILNEKQLDERFFKPELLEEIHKELDKDHKLDYKEKLALFLIRTTAELKNPEERCSAALKGDSSSGKDNAIKTILKHFPEEENFFLTRGTQAAIEEEAKKVKCIAFSEINKHREGANSELTEVFKQLAEGGTNTLKKDAATGYKTTINHKSEQKTLLYGTTETESDEELETRYVVIPIKSDQYKNQIVVNDVLNKLSNEEHHLEDKKEYSWISESIKHLNNDFEIIIPYAEVFKQKILDEDGKEKYLFDYTKERIKRDVKRLFSLTKAITWLYQKQRITRTIKDKQFLYADPTDFITALKIFKDFFNLTYSGLDHRLQKCYETIKKLQGKHDATIMDFGYETNYYGWVLRHLLQQELGIESVNTIKKRIERLKDLQLIETHYDNNIRKGYLVRYCQSTVKRLSLTISLTVIDSVMTVYLTGKNWYDNRVKKPIKLPLIDAEYKLFDKKKSVSSEKLTVSKLTVSKQPVTHTDLEVL